jgi:hypothetical protein
VCACVCMCVCVCVCVCVRLCVRAGACVRARVSFAQFDCSPTLFFIFLWVVNSELSYVHFIRCGNGVEYD